MNKNTLIFKIDADVFTNVFERDYEYLQSEIAPKIIAYKNENNINTSVKALQFFEHDCDNVVQRKVTVMVTFYDEGQQEEETELSISGTIELPNG